MPGCGSRIAAVSYTHLDVYKRQDQGRQFDKDGNMNNWWTDADAEAFKQKTDILVKQFDAIEEQSLLKKRRKLRLRLYPPIRRSLRRPLRQK